MVDTNQMKEKKANDVVTPSASNDSPTSLDHGGNVDSSVRYCSPHQMAGDVIVLASTSTHITNMIASPKKAKEDDGKQKKGLSKGLTNTSCHLLKDTLSNSRELQIHKG